jgi:biotin carboxylase
MGRVGPQKLLALGAGPAQLGLLAAARKRGHELVVADRDPSAPGFRYAHRRAIVSLEDEPALERLARAESIDAVATAGSDRALGAAARIAERLGLPHPLPSSVVSRAIAPQRRRDALVAAGVRVPSASVARTVDELRAAAKLLGFPCVVRAVDRPGADRVVRTDADLAGAAAEAIAGSRAEHCLVEAIPPGTRLAVSAWVVAGELRTVLVAARDPDVGVALAYSWPVPTDDGALAVVADAARALNVGDGPFHAEAIAGSEGAVVAEATPRIGGGHDGELARVAVGLDLNLLVVDAAVGEEMTPDALEPQPRVGGACVRFLVASPGELVEVEGLEDAYALDGISGVRVYRRRGHTFGRLARAADRAGAVLAVGDSREQAFARAELAADTIRFETAVEAAVLGSG